MLSGTSSRNPGPLRHDSLLLELSSLYKTVRPGFLECLRGGQELRAACDSYDDFKRAASSSSDFCLSDRFFGTRTLTRTNRSPLPCALFSLGIPRPASRNTCSGCVPDGILSVTVPSIVWTLASPPSAAVN